MAVAKQLQQPKHEVKKAPGLTRWLHLPSYSEITADCNGLVHKVTFTARGAEERRRGALDA